jgi:hypothetical protein
VGDFPGFLHKLDDPNNFGLRFNEAEVNNVANMAFAITKSLFMMASHRK